MNKLILLTPDELEQVTDGYWIGDNKYLEVMSFVISKNSICTNSMMIATSKTNWGSNVGNSHNNFKGKVSSGVIAFMLEKEFVNSNNKLPEVPVLVVSNTNHALRQIAIAIRDKSKAKRIQITGTEGKTGFKYLLDYLINKQSSCYAQKSSANLTTPILLSLTALQKETEYSVIEVSCPQPNRCTDRSKLIKPSLAIITNLNISHMNTHGSIHKLIEHKAESLDGLQKEGSCIINADTALYNDFITYTSKRKKINFLTYSEKDQNADGLLLDYKFEDLGWKVTANINNQIINYRVNIVQEHWPLTSVGILLTIANLGLDVHKAAADFKNFHKGWASMGSINYYFMGDGSKFLFYDQYFSITETAMKSAISDVTRIKVKGKKIAVISGEHNSDEFLVETHKRIAESIDKSDIDILFTVGEYSDLIINSLNKQSKFKGHFFKVEQLLEILIQTISADDLLFIKGMTKLNFKFLSEKINQRFTCDDCE